MGHGQGPTRGDPSASSGSSSYKAGQTAKPNFDMLLINCSMGRNLEDTMSLFGTRADHCLPIVLDEEHTLSNVVTVSSNGINQAPDNSWCCNMRNIFGLSVTLSDQMAHLLEKSTQNQALSSYKVAVSAEGVPRLGLFAPRRAKSPASALECEIDPFSKNEARRSACFPRLQFNTSNNTTKRTIKPLFVLKVTLVGYSEGRPVELLSVSSAGIQVFSNKSSLDQFLSTQRLVSADTCEAHPLGSLSPHDAHKKYGVYRSKSSIRRSSPPISDTFKPISYRDPSFLPYSTIEDSLVHSPEIEDSFTDTSSSSLDSALELSASSIEDLFARNGDSNTDFSKPSMDSAFDLNMNESGKFLPHLMQTPLFDQSKSSYLQQPCPTRSHSFGSPQNPSNTLFNELGLLPYQFNDFPSSSPLSSPERPYDMGYYSSTAPRCLFGASQNGYDTSSYRASSDMRVSHTPSVVPSSCMGNAQNASFQLCESRNDTRPHHRNLNSFLTQPSFHQFMNCQEWN